MDRYTKSKPSADSGLPVEKIARSGVRSKRSLGTSPDLGQRVDVLGGSAELGHAFGLRVIEKDAALGGEGIAVVEQQRGAAGEPARQPVPHHPAAGGEVEQPVSFAHIAVQLVFLQVLQQRAARAVDDALGHAGGAGGIKNVERVIEGQGGKLNAVHCGEGATKSFQLTASDIASS